MKKNNIPVGISDFEKIRKENYCYIDKSGLIKELLEHAGLVFVEAYDADTKEEANDMSERVCVIARENGK